MNSLERQAGPIDEASAPPSDCVTVLVVDDEPVNRQLLQGMLRHRNGIRFLVAADGADAVNRVAEERVDLVLMDVLMPGMDGYEATRRIKALDTDGYTPVLFVTALNDDEQLARCVACGGDDFIAKPVSRVQLNARVDSWLRIGQVYRTMRRQRDALDAYQRRNEVDQSIARDVLQRVTASEVLERHGVVYHYRAADILSGDMLLAAEAPDGRCFFMLADFTGHGIAASIGTVPAADLFYGAVGSGAGPEELLARINRKLYDYLPANLFMAATLLTLDPASRTVHVWNGGMPDVTYRASDGSVGRVASSHLPLGVQPRFGVAECTALEAPQSVWAVSDGVLEARNSHGTQFGAHLARQVLCDGGVALLAEAVDGHQAEARDDITMLELRPGEFVDCDSRAAADEVPRDWAFSVEMDARALREISPLQPIADGVARMEGLGEESRQALLTVLAELYSNCLEHGVLGLDSNLKSCPEGFTAYYEGRQKALADLRGGRVRIQIDRRSDDQGPFLVIRMADSGRGFDHQRAMRGETLSERALSGRGISLIQGICESLTYHGRGNQVEARYRLHRDSHRHGRSDS